MSRPLRRGAAAVAIAAVVGVAWLGAEHLRRAGVGWGRGDPADDRGAAMPRVEPLGPIPPEVPESSGLAVSRRHAGIFWTHNDSGDGPRLYALDSTAALVAVVDIAGAEARDWEALDIGSCPRAVAPASGEAARAEEIGDGADTPDVSGVAEAAWCLYIADTGDNTRRRPSVELYIVREPNADVLTAGVGVARLSAMVRLAYDGGPFDVEAVAVAPNGEVALVTKGRERPVRAFRLSASEVADAIASAGVTTLTGGVPLRVRGQATGAGIDPSGSVLALRTYSDVYFYGWPLDGGPREVAPRCRFRGVQPLGEAVAFSADGTLVLSSESQPRRPGRLLRVTCPGVRPEGERG